MKRKILFTCALLAFSACRSAFHMQIPKPTGQSGVGRTTFTLIDSSRFDPWSHDVAEHRIVPVKFWYPADHGTNLPTAAYLEGAAKLPGQFQFGERFVVQRMHSHAVADAPASGKSAGWPLLVLSPGADMPPDYYTSLVEDLVSREFAVMAIDHAHEGRGQILPDGRILTTDSERFRPLTLSDSAIFRFYSQRVDVRVADATFLIQALKRNMLQHIAAVSNLDLSRIGAIGHSLGGVAAGEMCRRDMQFVSCVNLDGLVRGAPLIDSRSAQSRRPLMYIGKPFFSPRGPGDVPRMQARLEESIATAGGGYVAIINGGSHDDFTDAPFLKPTVHPIEKRARLAELRELVAAFFDKTLHDRPAPILDDPASPRQKGVRLTRIAPNMR